MQIDKRYFKWMCQKIDGEYFHCSSYKKLLSCLNNKGFTYSVSHDGNRYEDGIDLRYRFAYENEIPSSIITSELDLYSCSILEMMVALALRCEEQIMVDISIGDRTSLWFKEMVKSLGLFRMTDDSFDAEKVNDILDRFIERRYDKNGKGGLFTTVDPYVDMRSMEIWYQMMKYLNEYLEGEI